MTHTSGRGGDDVSVRLPNRLAADRPGWRAQADVVVVGSGIAGLTAALRARRTGTVLLVTKADLGDGSTKWAQGGIAAAMGPGDTPDQHLRDTLVAGAGLCDEAAVRVLVTEGPGAVRRLIDEGASFDLDADGELSLTREGGHHRDRIAHAGGDATGAEISRALVAAAKADPGVEIIEHALVLDLLTAEDGAVCGVTLHVMGEGQRGGVGAVAARAVVLATGGMGQVFEQTTNPRVSTGDGVAVALRAGAEIADLEFVQFHPTVLYLGVRRPRSAAVDLGGGARRGCLPRRRRRQAVHDGAARAGRPRPSRRRRQGDHAHDARDRCGARLARRAAPRARSCGRTGSRRSSSRAAPTASTRSPSCSRSLLRATTPAAASARTWTAGRRCPGCTRAERSRAPASTAPTGWRPTPCSRAWSSPNASALTWREDCCPARNPPHRGRTATGSGCCRQPSAPWSRRR